MSAEMIFKNINFRDSNGRKKLVRVIFEDDDILVIDKPPGLPVIPDRWDDTKANLYDLLILQQQKVDHSSSPGIWVTHRIDSDTSGIVVFAKNAESHRQLNDAFENRQVRKTYLAIVKGSPTKPEGDINLPISVPKQGKVRIDPGGRPSKTVYKVIENFKQFSLLEVYPLTGRTHQIRIHLQAIGHALAIDPVYSGVSRIGIERFKRIQRNQDEKKKSLMARLSLHAYELQFHSPEILNGYQFRAEIPGDMMALLKALRKWDAV
jgi:23S rRNA pseudouridine955/2504/2580 synthase/23S rRNA pseudouridine1911/1915/1917 synthase